ncbi:hypothetical protein [Rhizobium sp. 1399]|jgi:hypothetical protein|uniref:hypothetical protein n=1 Tax=unclassified Rhizobium TaxID=2613769 RepID=UPI000DDEBC7C|nr:hypothetical protein [Rhizobium sp. 1399]MDR6663947.1 hypothetical protein [Rhizobium sp. 1399]
MSLLKFFLSQSDPAARVSQSEYDGDEDLLDHPDIASMSQRELADLPLPIPAPKRPLQRQLEKCT